MAAGLQTVMCGANVAGCSVVSNAAPPGAPPAGRRLQQSATFTVTQQLDSSSDAALNTPVIDTSALAATLNVDASTVTVTVSASTVEATVTVVVVGSASDAALAEALTLPSVLATALGVPVR